MFVWLPRNKATALPEDIKMVLPNKIQPQDKPIKNNVAITAPQGGAPSEARLEEPEPPPRHNPILHWILSIYSLVSVKVSAMRDGIKMFLQKRVHSRKKLIKSDTIIAKSAAPASLEARIEELEALPRRNPILHWSAFVIALLSLIILSFWVFSGRGPVPAVWVVVDIGIGIISLIEFFTRSGFRWDSGAYLLSHFFDFVAIVPALLLVNQGIAIELVWVWIILVARFIRVIDRLGGDGFVQRNIWALLEGMEEEITDRVLQRIIARVQGDMDRANFSHGVAEAFRKNKSSVLQRVRAVTPHEGVVPSLAHIVGLDAALERAEERTYDAVVQIIDSEEVDHAVRDVVNSVFSRMHNELGEKSWKQNIGIRHHKVEESPPI
jgi:hypothetical protein